MFSAYEDTELIVNVLAGAACCIACRGLDSIHPIAPARTRTQASIALVHDGECSPLPVRVGQWRDGRPDLTRGRMPSPRFSSFQQASPKAPTTKGVVLNQLFFVLDF